MKAKKYYTTLTGVILGCALLCIAPSRSQAILIGMSANNGNGTFTYSYTVDNTSGTFDIVAFSLEFNFLSSLIDWNQLDIAGGGSVNVADVNWIAQAGTSPNVGISSQDFFSINPASDVLMGTSLSGFSFISALAPGSMTYYFEFGASAESASGTTVGPVSAAIASVPDGGSSLALAFVSLSCIFGTGRWLKTGNGNRIA